MSDPDYQLGAVGWAILPAHSEMLISSSPRSNRFRQEVFFRIPACRAFLLGDQPVERMVAQSTIGQLVACKNKTGYRNHQASVIKFENATSA
jgi:hypothetical protein